MSHVFNAPGAAGGRPGHDYAAALRSREERVGVWGLGYIGWSTVQALVTSGLKTVGIDIDRSRVNELRASVALSDHLDLTSEGADVLAPDVSVHFVAVPTERDAAPYDDAIVAVFDQLVQAVSARRGRGEEATPPLVVIESTLTPGTVATVLLPLLDKADLELDRDLLIALAPRRDWFLAEGYNLRNLDRVYSGVGEASAEAAFGVLSILCERLHRASSHVTGELVKCVENAFRHVEITLANQLSLAYPHVDMVEVLKLAGTKWNMGEFHPSFGTGGYCIPLASRYVLGGADRHEELSILSAAIETDDRIRRTVVDSIADRGPVLVLGLAYKGSIKVATLSPAIAIVERLRELGVPHSVHDPMYSEDEINGLLGAGTATTDLGRAVAEAATVLIVADHEGFRHNPYQRLLSAERERPLLILDNYGALERQVWPDHVEYHRAGNAGWIADRDGAPA